MGVRVLVVAIAMIASLPAAGAYHVRDLDTEAPFGCFSGRDCIPAIHNPTFDDGAWLDGGDRVIGVALDGEARAYPVRILNWHEIANDVVNGTPLAVTYCPLCGTGIVFDRRLGGETLTFGVSGRLYRNDLVMYDRETESLWSQILGESIFGKLHGKHLLLVEATTTTWGEWKAEHPDTRSLARPSTYSESTYARYPYGNYEEDGSTIQPRTHPDDRLHPKAWVYGVGVPEGSVAFVARELERLGEARVRIGDADIVARRGGVGPSSEVVRGNSTEPIVGISAFWFAWHDFHPGTLVWPGDSAPVSGPPGSPGSSRSIPSVVPFIVLAVALGVAILLRRR